MKKANTKIYLGMDVSEKSIEIFALSTGKSAGKCISVENEVKTVNEFFDYFKKTENIVVALECGTHSPWLSELLEKRGYKVYVCNARKLRMIWQSNEKCDSRDAEMLARIAKFDPELLCPIRHRDKERRIDLAVVKSRDVLVRAKTGLMNSVRGQLRSFGIKTSSLKPWNFPEEAGKIMPEELFDGLNGLLNQIKQLDLEIRGYDKKITQLCKKFPETDKLRQVNGVGELGALTFVLVIDDKKRFVNGRRLASYLGLVPRRSQSGETDKQLGITKAGDKLLRRLMVQSANYIMGPFGKECNLRSFGERIASRGGSIARKKAKVAVARKLSILLLKLWESEEEYDPHYRKRKKLLYKAA